MSFCDYISVLCLVTPLEKSVESSTKIAMIVFCLAKGKGGLGKPGSKAGGQELAERKLP